MDRPAHNLPLRTALFYLLFGILWVLLSDRILLFLVSMPAQLAMYQTLKGWLFIAVSGLLLYFLLNREMGERRHMENALQVSQERLAGIVHSAMDGILSADSDQKIVLVNPAALHMFGYKEHELLGQPLDLLVPAEVRSIHRRHVEEFGRTGTTERSRDMLGEVRGLHANGTEFPIEASISQTDADGRRIYTVILRDITERKKAAAEILSLSKFPDENPSPVLRLTREGTILYANHAGRELLKTWKREVGGTAPEEWQGYIAQAFESGGRTELEFESQGRHYSCALSPIPATGYINIYCHDITKRKRAETGLRVSEERFRLLFEQNHAIMMLIEPESGAIRNANMAAAEYYGYSRAELCAMNINDINQLSADEVYAERMRALREERNFFRFQHRLSSGEIRSVEVHSAPMEMDGKTLLFSIIYDVTERNLAEEKVSRHINYLTALREIDQAITSSPDVQVSLNVVLSQAVSLLHVDAATILLLDPVTESLRYAAGHGFWTDTIQDTNLKGGESYAGKAALERRMVHISDLIHEPNNPFRRDFLLDERFVSYHGMPLIAKGKVIGVMEVFNRTPVARDQEWLDFLDSLGGQAAIAIDNAQLWEQTQRHARNLEARVAERTAELNRANVQLEHASRAKDEFLANMSHELRSPLNSILGMSESLLEQSRDPLSDYQRRSLGIIESSGRHLLDLINDILDVSKIDAGKSDHHPESVNVAEICQSSLTFVRAQAVRKSILVTYQEDPAVSMIQADPRRLKQILINLLTNAVKFTPGHGRVTLQVRGDAEHNIVQFSVSDTGIGISPEDLKRLFQPFVQVDSKLNRQHEGTGLGLTLVQKLTDLHGGSVEVESEVGVGSRFTINLPWDGSAAEGSKSARAEVAHLKEKFTGDEPEMPPERRTILLAEDNLPNILTIGEYLKGHGYEVIVAHDGWEALEQAERAAPDLILMDIQMPSLDGLEATRRLRTDPRFASTPIIALTALAMPGDRERCLDAGANEYMSKPVSLKSLRNIIQTLLAAQV